MSTPPDNLVLFGKAVYDGFQNHTDPKGKFGTVIGFLSNGMVVVKWQKNNEISALSAEDLFESYQIFETHADAQAQADADAETERQEAEAAADE